MRPVLLILFSLFLLGCDLSELDRAEHEKQKQSAVDKMPADARLIEVIPTKGNFRWDHYVIYEWRGMCFKMFVGNRRHAVTALRECPDE